MQIKQTRVTHLSRFFDRSQKKATKVGLCHVLFMRSPHEMNAQVVPNERNYFNTARGDTVKRDTGVLGVTAHISMT